MRNKVLAESSQAELTPGKKTKVTGKKMQRES